MTQATTETVDAVNACDDGDAVLIMLRPEGRQYWKWFRLNEREAVQLADQLRLLTRTTD